MKSLIFTSQVFKYCQDVTPLEGLFAVVIGKTEDHHG